MRHEALIEHWRPKTSLTSRNARAHWAKVKKADDWAKWHTHCALSREKWPKWLPDGGQGYRVTITIWQARGKLMDSDNAHSCAKAIRDGVARYLHVDDGQDGPEWVVRVERGDDAVGLVLEERNG